MKASSNRRLIVLRRALPPSPKPIGIGAAAEYLDAIGRDRIFEHDRQLAREAVAVLEEIPGLRILGPRGRPGWPGQLRAGIRPCSRCGEYGGPIRPRAARRPPLHPTLLRNLGVPAAARASFYFYNTPAEVERMGEILAEDSQILRMNFEELYQEVVLDHSKRPRNFGPLPDATAYRDRRQPLLRRRGGAGHQTHSRRHRGHQIHRPWL